MDKVNLEKSPAVTEPISRALDWKDMYLNLFDTHQMMRDDLGKDRQRLLYLANIDDSEILDELSGTNYHNWCIIIDAAIVRHQSMEGDTENDVDYQRYDEFYEDDDHDEDDDSDESSSFVNKLVLSIIIGGVFTSTASYFGVPYSTGVGVLAFMFSMLELWHKDSDD